MKNVLIISGSPRKKGNSQGLYEELRKGAEDKGNSVELTRLAEKKVGFCRACSVCMKNNGTCVQQDGMAEVLESFKKTDVLVLAIPVYSYDICTQMKTFINRTYPIWQHLGEKEVYCIISTGLGEDMVRRSLGDLDGLVEHLEKHEMKERIYATNVMDVGKICRTSYIDITYQMGCRIQTGDFLFIETDLDRTPEARPDSRDECHYLIGIWDYGGLGNHKMDLE